MIKARLFVLSLLLAILLPLGSCGGSSSVANAPRETEQKPPIQVVDAAGRTVQLDHIPHRIVIVGPAPFMPLHLLYMFPSARERLVGLDRKAIKAGDQPPLIDPHFEKVTLLDSPSLDLIAALQPDLVLSKGVAADSLSTALAQINIPIVYLGLETPELFFQDVTNMGVLLGEEVRAREIATFFQDRLQRVQAGVAGLAEDDKPRVLLVMYIDRGGQVAVQAPARSWMQTLEVETAGGRPVWLDAAAVTDGWTIVNVEQIAAWDAEKIFVVAWNLPDPQAIIDGLKADPRWSALRAVQNGELYAFPADVYTWDMADPRWILGMEWLASRLYPGRFQNLDMQDEVYQYFEQLYGMDRAVIDEQVMPLVKMDIH